MREGKPAKSGKKRNSIPKLTKDSCIAGKLLLGGEACNVATGKGARGGPVPKGFAELLGEDDEDGKLILEVRLRRPK